MTAFLPLISVGVNFFCVAMGAVMILIGSLALAMESLFVDLLEGQVTSPAVSLIIVGFITLVISLMGCYAIFKESSDIIRKYCIGLTALVIIKLLISLVAFLYETTFEAGFVHKYTVDFNLYFNDTIARQTIDANQEGLQCCGLTGPGDWYGRVGDSRWLPQSCCEDPTTDRLLCGYKFWTDGCLKRHTGKIDNWLHAIASTSLAFAIFEIFGVIMGMLLVRKIEADKQPWQEEESSLNAEKY